MMDNVGGPDNKRMRMAGGLMGTSPGQPPPNRSSKVVQIRGLSDQVTEADLLDACAQFGSVSYVSLTGRGTALLEFEAVRSAEECVTYNSTTDIFVLQNPTYFSFAQMDAIARKGLESAVPTNVLVLYVTNARYPITTDVMAAIFKPIAQPNRMVITRRQGVQVLSEFGNTETARNVKQRLNGCDIYSGCCTLKIEFAKLSRLNVTRNDQEQWDYVGGGRDRPSLLSEPPAFNENRSGGAMAGDEIGYDEFGRPIYDDPYGAFQEEPTGGGGMGRGPAPAGRGGGPSNMGAPSGPDFGYGGSVPSRDMGGAPGYGGGRGGADFGGPRGGDYGVGRGGGGGDFGGGGRGDFGGRGDYGGGMHQDYGRGASSGYMAGGGGGYGGGFGDEMRDQPLPDGTGMGFENAVLMLYGLTEEMNCDKLFNILCLYGNVVRVKFLKSKTDAAMAQMGDPIAADRVIRSLNKRKMFGKEIQVTMSKKAYLEDMRTEPFRLSDDTPSYQDYRNSRSNRFLTAEAAAKNRLNLPARTLYYFNSPTDITEELIKGLFEKKKLTPPNGIKQYQPRENSRSSAGLLDFETDTQALEAVTQLNHEPIESTTSRQPFLLKFAFAGPHGGGLEGGGGGDRGGRFHRDDDRRLNGPQHIVESRMRGGRGGFRGGRGRGSPRGRGGGRGGGRDRYD